MKDEDRGPITSGRIGKTQWGALSIQPQSRNPLPNHLIKEGNWGQ